MMKLRKCMAVLLAAMAIASLTGMACAETLEESTPELDGMMIVSLPDEADGILTYEGHAMLTGESVPVEYLEKLGYEPVGSTSATYSYIPVYTDGSLGEETVGEISTQESVRPTAEDLTISTYRNRTVGGIFPVSDDSVDYTCQVLTRPTLGMVTVEGGSFVYTPYQNRTGTDTFTYIVRDAQGAWSEEASVSIDIEKQESELVYSDLCGNAEEYAAIRLAEEGIYTGRSVGGVLYFEPDETVSRGEFIAMAMAAAGYEPAASVSTFFSDDDSIPAWTRSYVAAAVQEGIISGEETDGGSVNLRASDGITLSEAAVILENAVEMGSGDAVPAASVGAPAWAREALTKLCANGILAADAVAALNGEQTLTRGETAQILLHLMTYKQNAEENTGLFSWTTM